MPKTLPLPTLRACVASSKSLVGDDEAAAAAGIDGGEVLEAKNRPIRPGDVMVLVRRRGGVGAQAFKAAS